uniref:NHL repeat-containing protein 2 n=1 Tax=Ananas comosus var. bracteatus TaxID=296719 RepID=A0A6V7QCQ8_ANACO|nr:unnamed protein product [Ananas comosus var. bracteatus]
MGKYAYLIVALQQHGISWLILAGNGAQRQTVTTEANDNLALQAETLAFIKSTFNELEGPNYCWLNNTNGSRKYFNQEGLFLSLMYSAAEYSARYRELSIQFERLKLLQQRFPELNVFAVQCGCSANSVATGARLLQTIMDEYITYPILISDNDFMDMTNGSCYFLFESSTNHLRCLRWDKEPKAIVKVIETFNVLGADSSGTVQDSKSGWQRQHEAIKEPDVGSFRNVFLNYPGCVSVDENGNRIFISDSNHHRIIIIDGDGKILDCIGSSPGFEDGEFEYTKLLRPAASYYDAAEDCLYIVDSENHAIRRADLERRVVETIYPVCVPEAHGIWSWILDKLGVAREKGPKSKEFDADSITFPWHLIKMGESDLMVINRSFETSWIISMETGEIREVVRGARNVIELSRQTIMEKLSLLKHMNKKWPLKTVEDRLSLEGVPCAGFVSSIARFQDNIIFCDAAGQRVLKQHGNTMDVSCIRFSNFGVIGLPYWLVCPLERVFNSGYATRPWKEHIHSVNVLPGRCDIRVHIDIPVSTELAAPLEESSVWRQARGSVSLLAGLEGPADDKEKVGIAQQWFDELDNLAFTRPEEESEVQGEEELSDRSFRDKNRVHVDCAVNISPGQVVVSAVLYLKIKKLQENKEDHKALATRILDQPNPSGKQEFAIVELLAETCGDASDIIFMKPLHLRLRLECGDHPAAETNKETVFMNSGVNINVALE